MRYLDRSMVPAPTGLATYRRERHAWDETVSREPIRDALLRLQAGRCAYCECDLETETTAPHIEHFLPRSRFPELTFDWNNLFYSCTHARDSCGAFKDALASSSSPETLIKPDVDDPRAYLFFTSDGRVRSRFGLDAKQAHRAAETIRVFGLSCPRLRGQRKAALSGLKRLRDEASKELDAAEAAEYLADEAEALAALPFSSARLDVLGLEPPRARPSAT